MNGQLDLSYVDDLLAFLSAIEQAKPAPAQDQSLALDKAVVTIVEAIKNMPAPVVNVPAPVVNVSLPKKRPERTIVTEHDDKGRIKAYERYEIDPPDGVN